MKSYTKIVFLTAIVLTGCAKDQPPEKAVIEPKVEVEKTQPTESENVRETLNVTYTGTVKPGGISIYQEGSHRLILQDDRFVLLVSESVDLNGYVDEDVVVSGAVRPTVEEGGMVMRVENIQLQQKEEVEPEKNIAPPTNSENDPVEENPKEEPEENPEAEVPTEEEPVEPEEPEEEVVEASVMSPELIAITESMAKDDYSPERWTQPDYCTGHIGFCVPIHKNWWYKSFGNTSSDLWHLELSNAEISALGQGPIVVNLRFGSLASKKATDKEVLMEGDSVVGYRSWDDNSHFEITAHKSLENPVQYLTRELSRNQE